MAFTAIKLDELIADSATGYEMRLAELEDLAPTQGRPGEAYKYVEWTGDTQTPTGRLTTSLGPSFPH
jgi:hypothetical protein